jgi:hypothetical protein
MTGFVWTVLQIHVAPGIDGQTPVSTQHATTGCQVVPSADHCVLASLGTVSVEAAAAVGAGIDEIRHSTIARAASIVDIFFIFKSPFLYM